MSSRTRAGSRLAARRATRPSRGGRRAPARGIAESVAPAPGGGAAARAAARPRSRAGPTRWPRPCRRRSACAAARGGRARRSATAACAVRRPAARSCRRRCRRAPGCDSSEPVVVRARQQRRPRHDEGEPRCHARSSSARGRVGEHGEQQRLGARVGVAVLPSPPARPRLSSTARAPAARRHAARARTRAAARVATSAAANGPRSRATWRAAGTAAGRRRLPAAAPPQARRGFPSPRAAGRPPRPRSAARDEAREERAARASPAAAAVRRGDVGAGMDAVAVDAVSGGALAAVAARARPRPRRSPAWPARPAGRARRVRDRGRVKQYLGLWATVAFTGGVARPRARAGTRVREARGARPREARAARLHRVGIAPRALRQARRRAEQHGCATAARSTSAGARARWSRRRRGARRFAELGADAVVAKAKVVGRARAAGSDCVAAVAPPAAADDDARVEHGEAPRSRSPSRSGAGRGSTSPQSLRAVRGRSGAASPSAASPSATATAGCVTIAGGASGAGWPRCPQPSPPSRSAPCSAGAGSSRRGTLSLPCRGAHSSRAPRPRSNAAFNCGRKPLGTR